MVTDEAKVILTVIYVVTMVVAFAGNTLLIYFVWKKPEVRSMTSSMFVNMAVADLLITLVVMPFSVIHLHNGGKWLIVHDLAGEITCRGFYFVAMVTAASSILCLAFMAYDRYTAILHPFRPLQCIRKAKYAAPIIWILSMLLMSIILVISDFYPLEDFCGFNFDILGKESTTVRGGIFVYLFVVQYFLPLSVTSILYAKTAHKLWFRQVPGNYLSQNQRQQEIAKRKVVRMLVIVVAVFAVCWLPTQFFQLYQVIKETQPLPPFAMYLCYWLGHGNSAINPWLYISLSSRLRLAFIGMVKKKFSRPAGRVRLKKTAATTNLLTHGTQVESSV